jgi:hypothetical protein
MYETKTERIRKALGERPREIRGLQSGCKLDFGIKSGEGKY